MMSHPPQGQLDLLTVLKAAYPVGAVYTSVVSTSPATLFGFGTWAAFAAGKALVGLDSGDADFDAAEETGGSKTITLTTPQIPAHTHVQDAHQHTLTVYQNVAGGSGSIRSDTTTANPVNPATSSVAAVNQNTGGGGSHSNVQPYIVVYMWKRTA